MAFPPPVGRRRFSTRDLDSEIRRARQEGRDEGNDGALRGEAGVFLTMRYRVLITLLEGGVLRGTLEASLVERWARLDGMQHSRCLVTCIRPL